MASSYWVSVGGSFFPNTGCIDFCLSISLTCTKEGEDNLRECSVSLQNKVETINVFP